MTITDQPTTAPTAPHVSAPQSGSYWQMAILAIGFIMATLDATVVNVAGSDIGTNLHMGLPQVTWVIDAYVLTFASLLLLSGTLAGRYGAKPVYIIGLAVFVLASAACAIAPTGDVLIGARLVQGAGAAMFMPSSMALLARAFPDRAERGRALGLFSAIVSTASGLGPFIGGAVIATFGWRTIFLLNLPLGILGLVLANAAFPTRVVAPQRSPSVDTSWASCLWQVFPTP